MSMLARLAALLVGAALVTPAMPVPVWAQEALPPPHAEVQPVTAAPATVGPVSAVPGPAPVAAVPMVAPVAAVSAPELAGPVQAGTPPPPPPAPPAQSPPEDQDAAAPPPPPPQPPPPAATRARPVAVQARPVIAADARRDERSRYTSKGINIRVDATVTESRGDQVLGRKVVSVTLVDGEDGSVRSSAMVPISQSNDGPFQRVPLSMDAMVRLRDDNRVHARVTLDYNRGSVEIGESGTQRSARENFIRQSVSVILDNGKPLVVAQSADPEGDRRVTLELKATTLK